MSKRKRKSSLVRHEFPLKDNVYNRFIVLLYGTRDEMNTELERETPVSEKFVPIPHTAAGQWRIIKSDNGREAEYICVVHGTGWIRELSSLSHEAFHMVCYQLRMAGMTLTEENEEAYAYYLGWVMTQCLAILQKNDD